MSADQPGAAPLDSSLGPPAEGPSASPSSGTDLRSISLFQGLSNADLDRIFPAIRTRHVKRGTTLILARDLPLRVCFVWSGSFRLVLASPPKQPVPIKLLSAGNAFGYLSDMVGLTWGDGLRLRCGESGTLLEMSSEQFAAHRREIEALSEATIAMVSAVTADQCSRIFELAALSARERLQAELLRLARSGDWEGRRCILRSAPTQKELSELVGAAREVITRTLGALEDEGLIRVGRGIIELLDIDRLLALDTAATGRRMINPDEYASQRSGAP